MTKDEIIKGFTFNLGIGWISWNGQDYSGSSVSLTYSFLDDNSLPSIDYTTLPANLRLPLVPPASIGNQATIHTFSPDQRNAVTLGAMAAWAAVANINTKNVGDNVPDANITFANVTFTGSDRDRTGVTDVKLTSPSSGFSNATVWMANRLLGNEQLILPLGWDAYAVLLHETGHALGLDHPYGDAANEDMLHTIMSYNSPNIRDADGNLWIPHKPMLYDIYAIQTLYGVNTKTGGDNDNKYVFGIGADAVKVIWDAKGDLDEINATDQTLPVEIDLTPGEFSYVGTSFATSKQFISIAYQITGQENNWIENAIGGKGNDKLIGNDADNILKGGEGKDTLEGGKGKDTYYADEGDTIRDYVGLGSSDGKGKVYFADKLLSGGIKAAGETNWTDDDGYTYTLSGSKLTVENDNGATLTIENFKNKDLGIVLLNDDGSGTLSLGDHDLAINPTPTSPVTTDTLVGDLMPLTRSLALAIAYDASRKYSLDESNHWQRDPSQPNPNYPDILIGHNTNDLIQGLGGSDRLDGENGDDIIEGGSDTDLIWGFIGNDTLYADSQADLATIYDSDTVEAGTTQDWLAGGSGNDQLYGSTGGDGLSGGDGNDLIVAGAGDDYIMGDLAYAAYEFDWMATSENGTIIFDPVRDWSTYDGITADRNDTIFAGGGSDTVWADDGNDQVFGGAGNDKLNGEEGNDILFGNDGNDSLTGDASYIDVSKHGNDHLYGGADNDTLSGGSGEDFLEGGTEDDLLFGGDNNDILIGGADEDELQGGKGEDFLYGGTGNDSLLGGDNNDTLLGGSDKDQLQGSKGDDFLDGGTGNDVLFGEEDNDTLLGGDGNDTLLGGKGKDSLEGGAESDWLDGEEESDVIKGGGGADHLQGGGGNDTLYGGAGFDTYYFKLGDGVDTIYDSFDADTTANFMKFKGILFDDVVLKLGSLLLDLSNGDAVHIAGFDPDNPYTNPVISQFDFEQEDGTVESYSYEDLLAKGFDLTGTISADTISGTAIDDRINTLEGDDVVDAKVGDDTINLGAGNDYANAGSGNDTLIGDTGIDTLQGGLGDDFYVVDNINDQIIENTDEGYDTVESNASYILSANIENLNLTGLETIDGTGNDIDNILTGNEADNFLSGLDGNDTLIGDAGNDTLQGGTGDDFYAIDNNNDQIIENADEGYDTVESTCSYILPTNTENLTLTGWETIDATGNDIANILIGNEADNLLSGLDNNDTLNGNAGNDTLDGGAGDDSLIGDSGEDLLIGNEGNDSLDGGYGIDTLQGGLGDDVYSVDEQADRLIEYADEGYDTVYSRVTYTLSDYVETLVLLEANNGTGSAQDNLIIGNELDNVLDGQAGVDTLEGGRGDDTYKVDNTADAVIETGTPGYYSSQWNNWGWWGYYSWTWHPEINDNDTVLSSATYTLSSWIENLTLTGTEAIDGVGNELNNFLQGNLADNALTGLAGNDSLDGGLGMDTLSGGYGDDVYQVDNNLDVCVEETNAGYDSVYSQAGSYTLSAEIEDLFLVGQQNINGTGNDLNNYVTGNNADNILQGQQGNDSLDGGLGNDTLEGGLGNDTLLGGTGDDTLQGGLGDDFYLVDSSLDQIIENADEGLDKAQATSDYTLSDEVENLQLMGDFYQSPFFGNLSGIGNILNNNLIGNDAHNLLQGLNGDDVIDGRAGNDTLEGGDGNDNLYGGNDAYYWESGEENTVFTDWDDVSAGWFNLEGYAAVAFNNDVIRGQEGDDTIDGGSGDDALYGDAGADLLYGGNSWVDSSMSTGNDTLDGGEGIDTLIGGAGDDVYYVDGESSQFTLPLTSECHVGSVDDDPGVLVQGVVDVVIENQDEGYDIVYSSISMIMPENVEELHVSGASNVDIIGNNQNNAIEGNDSDNWIDGGVGMDSMAGGLGNDTYVVDDESDVVTEQFKEGNDTVRSFSYSYYLPDNVENLDLAGAATYGYGNALDNLIRGNTADNTLEGGDGNDTLTGWSGNDWLDGGNGDDRYIFSTGFGIDTVYDSGGSDEVRLNDDLTLSDITLSQDGGDVIVGIKNTADQMRLLNWFNPDQRIEALHFCDGTLFDAVAIEQAINNVAPIAFDDAIAISEDNPSLTGNVLSNDMDSNQEDIITLSNPNVYLGNYGSLNLQSNGDFDYSFNNGNADLQYLAEGQNLTDVFSYTALDNDPLQPLESNVATLTVTIEGHNDAPVATQPIAGQTGKVGELFSFTVPTSTFTDVDQGDVLTLSAQFANGNPLPSWLHFNPLSNTLSGTAQATDSGLSTIDVIATDSYGASVNSSFALTIAAPTSGVILGTPAADTLNGSDYNDWLQGLSGNDKLFGKAGNDTLEGGSGNDTLIGGTGDDSYWVDSSCQLDKGNEGLGNGEDAPPPGHDSNQNDGSGTSPGHPNQSNTLDSKSGSSANSGNSNHSTENSGIGSNEHSDNSNNSCEQSQSCKPDTVIEQANQGNDTVYAKTSFTLPKFVESLKLLGNADISGTGNTGDNILIGQSGANTLSGAGGHDLLIGGAGQDNLVSGNGSSLLIGGNGNDQLSCSGSYNLIAFNRGDGQDTLNFSGRQTDTLSLGAGIRYSDLSLHKSQNDLILELGSSDNLTFKDWYAKTAVKNVQTLQMITGSMAEFNTSSANPLLDNKIETFDFISLVKAFDSARSNQRGLSNWTPTSKALIQTHLSGSNTEALGGDLAYQYGVNTDLNHLDLATELQIIGSANFASAAQSLLLV